MNETASPRHAAAFARADACAARAGSRLRGRHLPMIALRDAEKRSTRTHAATASITDRIASACPQNGE